MGVASSKVHPDIHITLDALGTLYKFKGSIPSHYIHVARTCGVKQKIDERELEASFKQSFKSLSKELPNYGKNGMLNGFTVYNPNQWWTELAIRTFTPLIGKDSIPSNLGLNLYNHFSSNTAYELYPDVKPFFSELRQLKAQYSESTGRYISVGVVSNSDPRVYGILQSLRIAVDHESDIKAASVAITDFSREKELRNQQQDVDFVLTSYLAGHEKPNKQIFRKANLTSQQRSKWRRETAYLHGNRDLRKLAGSTGDEFLHIGDDYEKDYLGARNAGMTAFHLVRNPAYARAEAADYTITDLRQALVPVRIMIEQSNVKNMVQ